MNVLVVGAGRMGQRHCIGIAPIPEIKNIAIVDISEVSLNTAKELLKANENQSKFQYALAEDFWKTVTQKFDYAIIAATANNRIEQLQQVINTGVKAILIEKPLGQSLKEVQELCDFAQKQHIAIYVNLNMRQYITFNKLKNDIQTLPQFNGEKTITINTGTLGIGANGIHYLDLINYLLDATQVELVAGEIDENIIPSGRGENFKDYGGWAVIKYYNNDSYVGKALISMSANSTALGSWEILGTHGRIFINELEQKRITQLRKADSAMPMNRYAADYGSIEEEGFLAPFLGDLTHQWLVNELKGKATLPNITEALISHQLLFNWLEKSKNKATSFPIT